MVDTQASKVTEIRITSEAVQAVEALPKDPDEIIRETEGGRRGSRANPYAFYSVTVESGDGYGGNTIPMKEMETHTGAAVTQPRRAPKVDANAAAWVYCKYAMLYFVALLVTWVRLLSYYLHEIGDKTIRYDTN